MWYDFWGSAKSQPPRDAFSVVVSPLFRLEKPDLLQAGYVLVLAVSITPVAFFFGANRLSATRPNRPTISPSGLARSYHTIGMGHRAKPYQCVFFATPYHISATLPSKKNTIFS
jgi:hypothetical protein